MSTSKKLKTKTLRECGICGKKLKNPKSKVHLKSVHHKKKLAYSRGGKYIKEFENEEAKKRFLKLYNEGRRIGAKLYYGRGNYMELEKLMRESLNWHRLNAMKEYNSNNKNVPLLVSNVVEVNLQDEMKDLFGEDEEEDEYWDNDDQIYQEEEGDLGMGFGINEDNNKCHEGGISYENHDKLLEDYREMMLRKKLRLALPPKRGYEPPTWIPKHIWVQRVERMNFFREDINKSKDDVKECVIRKFPERDYSKKKDNFECEYCDIEFNNNKDFYDHCQLLSHQYNAGLCVIKRNNKKIESLSIEYKPEELGKNGKPKKAYRESRKKFKERMFKEMAIDYENEDNDKNESMYQVGDGEQFNYKCYPMNEDWRYGLDKDRDVEIVEPDISDFDPKYVKEYLIPTYSETPEPSIQSNVDDQWFEDWEDIFNLDDMDDFI